MLFKKGLLLLLALSLLAPLFARAEATAFDELEKDLLAATKITEKSMTIYSYFNAPTQTSDQRDRQSIHSQLGSTAQRENWLKQLLKIRAGTFWDLSFQASAYINAGPGQYFAIDPASSKEFGNAAIVLNIPAQKKYLTVLKPIQIKKVTMQLLIKEGLVGKEQMNPSKNTLGLKAGFTRLTLKNMVRPENIEFRKLINRIFNENNIQLIEYQYKSYVAGFCKISSQAAFVFIGAANLADQKKALIGPEYDGYTLISELPILNQSAHEENVMSKTIRFREALLGIRKYGTKETEKLMKATLSQDEISDLSERTYQCNLKFKL